MNERILRARVQSEFQKVSIIQCQQARQHANKHCRSKDERRAEQPNYHCLSPS